ncbi:hypothetical protein F4808DRAFT_181796 [Astrocystis sublimbata]|nr:hypothetical protein F4808DRAFT_181796 [Astrocystis sublimbata]
MQNPRSSYHSMNGSISIDWWLPWPHTKYQALVNYPRQPHDTMQCPKDIISHQHQSWKNTNSLGTKECLDQSLDLGNSVPVELPADLPLGNELPVNKENYSIVGTPEATQTKVVKQNSPVFWSSAANHKGLESKDQPEEEAFHPIEGFNSINVLACNLNAADEALLPSSAKIVARNGVIACSIETEKSRSPVEPSVLRQSNPHSLGNGSALNSPLEDSAMDACHLCPESPIIPHHLYRAREKSNEAIMACSVPHTPSESQFADSGFILQPIITRYRNLHNEGSAWETVTDDVRLQSYWGNGDTHEQQQSSTKSFNITREYRTRKNRYKNVVRELSQRQLPVIGRPALKLSRVKALAIPEPIPRHEPRYFDTVSEGSDDQLVKKLGTLDTCGDSAAGIITGKRRFDVAANASDEEDTCMDIRRPRQMNLSDKSFLVTDDEPQDWLNALEKENDADMSVRQFPRPSDYFRFLPKIPTACASHPIEGAFSDTEIERLKALSESWRLNVPFSDPDSSMLAQGGSDIITHDPEKSFIWSSSSSSSIEECTREEFEPLLDDALLENIDIAFVPSQTLGTTTVQDQAPGNTGISVFKLSSISPSRPQYSNISFGDYTFEHDQSDDLSSQEEEPVDSKRQSNNAQTYVYLDLPIVPPATSTHFHHFDYNGNAEGEPFQSSRAVRDSSSDGSFQGGKRFGESTYASRSATEYASFDLNRPPHLRGVGSSNEDQQDGVFQVNSEASNSSELEDPIYLDINRAESLSFPERGPTPLKSTIRTPRPSLVYFTPQRDEGLVRGSPWDCIHNFVENPRCATPAIVLPNLGHPIARELGRARILRQMRQQRFEQAEEKVATAVIIYATAQKLISLPSPHLRGDLVDKNYMESLYAHKGPVQSSSKPVLLELPTDFSNGGSGLSQTVADLSTDEQERDRDRDRHHRHRSHRSHHHSTRSKETKNSDEPRHHHHRHHKSKDDNKASPKTDPERDRSVSARHKREESRRRERHDSGYERSHESSHRRRRSPESQAAHEKRKEERRVRRELEREQERESERERERKAKEAETSPPPEEKTSPRPSRRSRHSHPERRASIKEEPSPVSGKRFFDFIRGESNLAAANVSSKAEPQREEAPKRSSPPTSASKSHSHSTRTHRETSEPPRPRSSRHHDSAPEDSPSRRHRDRSSRRKLDDEPKMPPRSRGESQGRYTTRPRADSDAKGSTRSRGDSDARPSTRSRRDSDARPSSSSHAKPRSAEVKEDRHDHKHSRRAERQRERDAEKKKKEAPSGLKSVFKKIFA